MCKNGCYFVPRNPYEKIRKVDEGECPPQCHRKTKDHKQLEFDFMKQDSDRGQLSSIWDFELDEVENEKPAD